MNKLQLAAASAAVLAALASAGARAQAPAAVAAAVTPSQAHAAPADWYFSRGEQRLRVVKGDIEEIWQRESRGQVSFERIFHADQRRVFYTPGELRTLGIEADWAGAVESIERSGLRERAEGEGAQPPKADHYERLDAADLGDMDYDAFARKAEAYDVKLGWRQPHEH